TSASSPSFSCEVTTIQCLPRPCEVEAGNEWIVDADLKDYFGSVDHDRLMTLIGKQIADRSKFDPFTNVLPRTTLDPPSPVTRVIRLALQVLLRSPTPVGASLPISL